MPTAANMYPSWLTVEYASTRLMSGCPRPAVPSTLAADAAVARALSDERVHPRRGRQRAPVPGAGRGVRAEGRRRREDVQEEGAAREHEHRHREHEQGQIREIPRVARIVAHVADRVE